MNGWIIMSKREEQAKNWLRLFCENDRKLNDEDDDESEVCHKISTKNLCWAIEKWNCSWWFAAKKSKTEVVQNEYN